MENFDKNNSFLTEIPAYNFFKWHIYSLISHTYITIYNTIIFIDFLYFYSIMKTNSKSRIRAYNIIEISSNCVENGLNFQ